MSIDMRPRSIGEILDTSFRLVVRDLGTWALIVLIGVGPFTVVAASGYVEAGSILVDVGIVGVTVLGALGLLTAIGALTWGVHRVVEGDEAMPGASLRRGVALLLKTLGVTLVTYVALVLVMFALIVVSGILFGLGALVNPILGGVLAAVVGIAGGLWMLRALTPRLFLAMPVMVIEGEGVLRSFKRGHELSAGARGRLVVLFFATYIIVALPSIAILVIVGGVGSIVDPTSALAVLPLGWFIAQQGLSLLATMFTMPLFIAVAVLAYYDRRVTTEGFDVESAAATLDR